MRLWILVLAAFAFVAAGTAMADQCQTPCAKAQATACGASMAGGGKAACGGKMDCGPAGACDMQMKMVCSGPNGLHASHDPNNIWYRGPAPKGCLFDSFSDRCRPDHGRRHKIFMMKRMGGCGPMGMCEHGPACGGACVEKMSDEAMCGHGPACGGTCMGESEVGEHKVVKKIIVQRGGKCSGDSDPCGSSGALRPLPRGGAKPACGPRPACEKGSMPKTRAGSWQTGWSHCPQAQAKSCGGCHE